jgi:hypothetical protein
VLERCKIETLEEKRSVALVLRLLKSTNESTEQQELLISIIITFNSHLQAISNISSSQRQLDVELSNEDIDGLLKHPIPFNEKQVTSPDGNKNITITGSSDSNSPSTIVSIFFENASGVIYATYGLFPDIKAMWKDNGRVLIETKEAYPVGVRHKKVQSSFETVYIEYGEIA